MKCPTCLKEFFVQPDKSQYYYFAEQYNQDIELGFGIAVQLCPSCHNLIVIYQEGQAAGTTQVYIMEKHIEKTIYPFSTDRLLPEQVPDDYREEYSEASRVVDMSPKASAALSRRLLQKIFHQELNIKKKNLSDEIDEFIASSAAPTYLSDAVDAIRNIGNFAAHPVKNTNTGEIVDVEPGEAEWLLEVLEALCDFVFVQPVKLKERKESLNEKLEKMGKQKLKGL